MKNKNPLKSIRDTITFSPYDWSEHPGLSWIYGIACGWDDDSLSELTLKHNWSEETVSRLKLLRANYESLSKLD